MPERDPLAFPAEVAGLLRGRELTGCASIGIHVDGIVVAAGRDRIVLSTAMLNGVEIREGTVTLFVDSGDEIHLRGSDELSTAIRDLVRRACALPEMTRSLRGFGSRRGGGGGECAGGERARGSGAGGSWGKQAGSSHDRFFQAFLEACRRAHRAADLDSALAALDSRGLRDAVVARTQEFALERHATRAPERRALEAELLECAEALLHSLTALERAQHKLLETDDSEWLASWRGWTGATRAVFERADACWISMRPLLQEPVPRPKRWQWLSLPLVVAILAIPVATSAQHITLRVPGVSADSLRAADFDVVAVLDGDPIVVADSAESDRLVARGWTASPIPVLGASPRDRLVAATPPPVIYRPFNDLRRGIPVLLDSFARATSVVHLDTFGRSVSAGALASPPIAVPTESDSVSVLFWTRYSGDPFALDRRGEVRFSMDGGARWALAGIVGGDAPVYYPERVDITGVAGRRIQLRFDGLFAGASPAWWLDEIIVVAHLSSARVTSPVALLRPSENPVRGARVRFSWPFGAEPGDVRVFDFAGRIVWSAVVASGSESPVWDVAAAGARNGVYVVIARGGGRVQHLKLFVSRRPA